MGENRNKLHESTSQQVPRRVVESSVQRHVRGDHQPFQRFSGDEGCVSKPRLLTDLDSQVDLSSPTQTFMAVLDIFGFEFVAENKLVSEWLIGPLHPLPLLVLVLHLLPLSVLVLHSLPLLELVLFLPPTVIFGLTGARQASQLSRAILHQLVQRKAAESLCRARLPD